jgi:hypothetical protein
MQRLASCGCGGLNITASGEPIKVSACHCVSCRKRTGTAFGVAVFFEEAKTTPSGPASQYVRPGDSGQTVTFYFCPMCASTVYWRPAFQPSWVGIAIGCFDDKTLRPTQAVYEHERLEWASVTIDPKA